MTNTPRNQAPADMAALAQLEEVAEFAENNAKATHLTMDADVWRAHGRKVREVLAALRAAPPATAEPGVGLRRIMALENTIRDTIESLERNSTSAPVVKCLKAALAASPAPHTEVKGSAEVDLTACMRECWCLITDGMSKEDFFAASAVMIQDRIRQHFPRPEVKAGNEREGMAAEEKELFSAATKIDVAAAVTHIRNWRSYIDDHHRQKYADLIEAQAKLIAWFLNARALRSPPSEVEAWNERAFPAAGETLKLVYIKRWRTIISLPAKYADEIVAALRSSGNAVAMREALERLDFLLDFGDEPSAIWTFDDPSEIQEAFKLAKTALAAAPQAQAAGKLSSGTFLGYRDEHGNEMHCANAFCPSQDKCHKGCVSTISRPVRLPE